MHTLSPHEGPAESFFNFIENPLSVLCSTVLGRGAAGVDATGKMRYILKKLGVAPFHFLQNIASVL